MDLIHSLSYSWMCMINFICSSAGETRDVSWQLFTTNTAIDKEHYDLTWTPSK